VSISREEGRPTILEQRRREEAERRQRVEAEPLVQAVLAAFPGARLGEVRVAAEPPRPVGDVEDDDADEPDAEEAGASDNGEHDAVFENGVDAED
jgi:DNA polymerase-3 subunit gamma/tau